MTKAKTLNQAIEMFLASLDDLRKNELCKLIPSPREEHARKWIDEVITMFNLNQHENELNHDIEQLFPDESVFKGAVFDNANGIFEAEIILWEARKWLLEVTNDKT